MVNYKNKDRIMFIERMSFFMRQFNSSKQEINELVQKLYCKSSKIDYKKTDTEFTDDVIDLKEDYISNDKTIREIYMNDLILYMYSLLLFEYLDYPIIDELNDIISQIYYKLDDIMYPYKKGRDIKNLRFYIELEFDKEE